MNIFSIRLKELRVKNGTLQKELASLLQISDRQFRSYEAGKVDPPTSKSILLANYFNVSLDYLVGLSDDPTRH